MSQIWFSCHFSINLLLTVIENVRDTVLGHLALKATGNIPSILQVLAKYIKQEAQKNVGRSLLDPSFRLDLSFDDSNPRIILGIVHSRVRDTINNFPTFLNHIAGIISADLGIRTYSLSAAYMDILTKTSQGNIPTKGGVSITEKTGSRKFTFGHDSEGKLLVTQRIEQQALHKYKNKVRLCDSI